MREVYLTIGGVWCAEEEEVDGWTGDYVHGAKKLYFAPPTASASGIDFVPLLLLFCLIYRFTLHIPFLRYDSDSSSSCSR